MKHLICKIFGHSKKTIRGKQKDMFGYEYVWQPEYCSRCGERVN